MTPKELEELRSALDERKRTLLEQGNIEVEPVRKDASAKLDEDEAPLTEMNQVIASKRNRDRTQELEKIEAALRRIAQAPEDFGYCADCEEPIGAKRLRLMPWARFCLECQQKRDPARRKSRRSATDYLE